MGKHRHWWLVFLLLGAPALAIEKGDEALVTGDAVRVRAQPLLTAPQVGYLYKNLRVRVLEKSAHTTVVDGAAYSWYRVRWDDVEGWCSGAFLNFTVPGDVADTYAAPAEMDWFFARYGYGTYFQENAFGPDSFSIDEYRKLMASVQLSGANTSAPIVLRLGIYPYLQKHPDDAKYQYLKAKLYSPEVLQGMLNAYQFELLPLLPPDLARKAFIDWFNNSPSAEQTHYMVLWQIPKTETKLRQELAGIMLSNSPTGSPVCEDLQVVREAVAADGLLLRYAGSKPRDDFETVMIAVKSNYSAVQWASARLQADDRIREVVGKRTIRGAALRSVVK